MKRKGWRGESRRHSLARKGIGTVQPNESIREAIERFQAEGNYNYWEQLYPTVMDHVEHYQNDFLVHDKKLLEGVDEFVMGIRETGTDTFIMDYREDFYEARTLEEILALTGWVTGGRNDKFFWGKDGVITEITMEEAEKLMKERVKENEKLRKVPFTQFPSATDSEIFREAKNEIEDRRNYGMREEKVEPKKFYTRLFWSNSDASWHSRTEHFTDKVAKLDANEILLPYRAEEVNDILDELPPLPLYVYSHEGMKRTLMTEDERKQLKKEWVGLQGEQFRDKEELL